MVVGVNSLEQFEGGTLRAAHSYAHEARFGENECRNKEYTYLLEVTSTH